MKFPTDGNWSISNKSDLFGHLVRTKNLDFNRAGYLSLARKPTALYTTDSNADFGRLVAVSGNGTHYFFITTTNVFSLLPSNTALNFTEITDTSMPDIQVSSDAVFFNGDVQVSGLASGGASAVVHSWDASQWNSRVTSLEEDYPVVLCVFENRTELAVGNKNTVKTYNTSYSNQNTLTLPANYIVTTMRWRSNKLYIGTRDVAGGNGIVFIWNGTGTSAQEGYDSGANWVYSMTEYGSSVVILTSGGQLRKFNGGGFDDLANLPVYYSPHSWLSNTGTSGTGKCLNRGMWTEGTLIYLNINGEVELNNGAHYHTMPSGLWVYDPDHGLYHKGGFVTEKWKDLAINSLASSTFTMASAHGAETGDAVWASSVANIAALAAGQIYYAIKESSTVLKLALSPADALAGRHITCSGTISGDKLAFDDLAQVANTVSCLPGPVYGFAKDRPNLFFASEVFYGGSSQDLDGNTISALMSFGMGRSVGSFVTAKISAEAVIDSFQKLYASLPPLRYPTDSIVIKYRTQERFGLPTPIRYGSNGRATWTSDSAFTVNTTLKDIKSAQVGDELEIVEGAGAGYSGHIIALDDSSNPYAYTIDEDIPLAVDDLSDIYVDNWKKLAVFTKDTSDIDKGWLEQALGTHGTWVQFKVELRGRDVAINMLDVISEAHKPAL